MNNHLLTSVDTVREGEEYKHIVSESELSMLDSMSEFSDDDEMERLQITVEIQKKMIDELTLEINHMEFDLKMEIAMKDFELDTLRERYAKCKCSVHVLDDDLPPKDVEQTSDPCQSTLVAERETEKTIGKTNYLDSGKVGGIENCPAVASLESSNEVPTNIIVESDEFAKNKNLSVKSTDSYVDTSAGLDEESVLDSFVDLCEVPAGANDVTHISVEDDSCEIISENIGHSELKAANDHERTKKFDTTAVNKMTAFSDDEEKERLQIQVEIQKKLINELTLEMNHMEFDLKMEIAMKNFELDTLRERYAKCKCSVHVLDDDKPPKDVEQTSDPCQSTLVAERETEKTIGKTNYLDSGKVGGIEDCPAVASLESSNEVPTNIIVETDEFAKSKNLSVKSTDSYVDTSAGLGEESVLDSFIDLCEVPAGANDVTHINVEDDSCEIIPENIGHSELKAVNDHERTEKFDTTAVNKMTAFSDDEEKERLQILVEVQKKLINELTLEMNHMEFDLKMEIAMKNFELDTLRERYAKCKCSVHVLDDDLPPKDVEQTSDPCQSTLVAEKETEKTIGKTNYLDSGKIGGIEDCPAVASLESSNEVPTNIIVESDEFAKSKNLSVKSTDSYVDTSAGLYEESVLDSFVDLCEVPAGANDVTHIIVEDDSCEKIPENIGHSELKAANDHERTEKFGTTAVNKMNEQPTDNDKKLINELNPMSTLEDLCMHRNWTLPKYEFFEERNGLDVLLYSVKCTVKACTVKVGGRSKEEAQRKASTMIFDTVKHFTSRSIVSLENKPESNCHEDNKPIDVQNVEVKSTEGNNCQVPSGLRDLKKVNEQEEVETVKTTLSSIKKRCTENAKSEELATCASTEVNSRRVTNALTGHCEVTAVKSEPVKTVDTAIHCNNIIVNRPVKDFDTKLRLHPTCALQELCMSRKWPMPEYESFINCSDCKSLTFSVTCTVSAYSVKAEGFTKKAAKRQAATVMYRTVEKVENVDCVETTLNRGQ